KAYGGRFRYYFNPKNDIVIFMGIEGDVIKFDLNSKDNNEKISGKGYMAYFFVGQEFFMNDNFTFYIDLGPSQIALSENEFNLDVKGIEWIYNLGINFYFGSSGKKRY
ncbi:MAG: hypothetical protein QMD92_08405, partial [bacterium]|nr:hypothetical protein [bacterium]